MKKLVIIISSVAILFASCGQTSDSASVSDVYFTKNITVEGFDKIFKTIEDALGKGRIGVKVHFGQPGNEYYVKPYLFENIVKKINGTFVETNVLYGGPRGATESHIQVAKDHGFGYAPIDIMDEEKVISGVGGCKHYAEFYVGEDLDRYDNLLILSHFKGHGSAGFGGAIKNVSMGFATPRGKLAMHKDNIPVWVPEQCSGCGLCSSICPENAIISLEPFTIDRDKCIGCGKCISECPERALEMPKQDNRHQIFCERLVEYAKAVQDNHSMVYINVLVDISNSCDCNAKPGKPFVPDIGIVASTDMVAIEKASHDLVAKAHKCKDPFLEVNKNSGLEQIRYAHKLGMGNIKYKLINID